MLKIYEMAGSDTKKDKLLKIHNYKKEKKIPTEII